MSSAHSVRISCSLEAHNLQRNLNDSFLQGEMQEIIKIKIRDLLKQKIRKYYTFLSTQRMVPGAL
jgi:hypothetical protein